MRVASIDADAGVLAQVVSGHPSVQGCHLTGHIGHVTVSTSPS